MYETAEIIRQDGIIIRPHHISIGSLKCSINQRHQAVPKRLLPCSTIVCILAPTTGREVCLRLWPPLSTKTLSIMHRLLCTLLCMQIDKDTTLREPRTSYKSQWKAGWQYQLTDQLLPNSGTDGGRREDTLWRAIRMRKFPKNAIGERRMWTAVK